MSATGSEAFRWTAETGIVSLNDDRDATPIATIARGISDDGLVVVGRAVSSLGMEAFRWTEREGVIGLGDLPGGIFRSEAGDVSTDGAVIVGQARSNIGDEAFRWTEDQGMVGLGHLPGGFNSAASGVSADGAVVVGHSCITPGPLCLNPRPFVWDAAHGMRDLYGLLTGFYGLDLSGWTLYSARGVSADGLTIVGSGANPDGFSEGWIVTLPDCNKNGVADDLDILDGDSSDADGNSVPDECEKAGCPADLTADGIVDALDLAMLLGAWGPAPGHAADLNKDLMVSAGDLLILLGAWGPC